MYSKVDPATRPQNPCANPYCDNVVADFKLKRYCSKDCCHVVHQVRRYGEHAGEYAAIRLGQLIASRVYFWPCIDCGQIVCTRSRVRSKIVCVECRKVRLRAVNARKNHNRRAAGKLTMSVYDIAGRDGRRCNICRRKVDMQLSGNAKWGPTIDHILPVSFGGTNEPSNLALTHRACNVARKNRTPAQMLLAH